MNIPLQLCFLYKKCWTPEIDTVLVDTIVRLKDQTKWVLTEFPNYFFFTAAKEIKNLRGTCFTEDELRKRVKFMQVRYQTFKEIINHEGAFWDMPSKSVIVADDVWIKIFKKNAFAAAYYYNHEPLYNKLVMLFGMEDVKIEDEKEVIVISETTEKLPTEDTNYFTYDEGSEEVNSPFIFPSPNVRRKLFVEDGDQTDRESTTLGRDRVLPKPPLVPSGKEKSSRASSCASTSPIGWWHQVHI
ncbi:hypothetical protein AAHA92_17703 [Salvia divinorum]|uniref:Myb/SANT-like domain-containing protein n=1 Tax=Salvia divinorum TaxID=28513 RepID=A0ABD1H2U5_SALDI